VIALVIGELSRGPVPLALEREGLDARETASVEQAEWDIQNEGEDGCVLVLDAAVLTDGERAWRALLERYPALPAVALHAEAGRLRLGGGAHRIALAEAFDAAAVVRAVRRATASAPGPASGAARELEEETRLRA